MFKLTATLLTALTILSPVQAWPTGAGACPKGEAAVKGPHLGASNELTGSLEEAAQGLQVLLNGEPLTQDTMVPVDETMDVQIVSDMPFRGFLIRFGPSDDSGVVASMARSSGQEDFTMALNPLTADDAEVKLEERYCIPEGVAGVCHSSNTDKTSVAATLEVPGEGEYMMDVTVVIALAPASGVSEYYHTTYMVKTMGAGESAPMGGTTDFTPPPMNSTTEEVESEPMMEETEITEAPVSASGSVSIMAKGFSVAAMATIVALFL